MSYPARDLARHENHDLDARDNGIAARANHLSAMEPARVLAVADDVVSFLHDTVDPFVLAARGVNELPLVVPSGIVVKPSFFSATVPCRQISCCDRVTSFRRCRSSSLSVSVRPFRNARAARFRRSSLFDDFR
jgi:hypothetical protein